MAQQSQPTSLTPAQLWLGPHELLVEKAEQFLQQRFCPHGSCMVCGVCEKIRQRRHHGALWLLPEKSYTLDDLVGIFDTISLALNPDEQFFFILQKAELLTTACANRLLKSIEEPPPGYHFLLLAEHRDALLPTIRSRCTIQSFFSNSYTTRHERLMQFFTSSMHTDPGLFLKELDTSKINEQESLELLNQLIEYWSNRYKDAVQEPDKKKFAEKKVDVFTQALLTPPMPGSSKIFWKNLFLHMY